MVRRPVLGRDEGAAVVEYVLVSVLLIVVFLAVAQVALLVHARDVLVADAAEGARTAALRGSTLVAGEEDCAQLLRQTLSPLLVGSGRPCQGVRLPGEPALVAMRIHATMPMTLLPFGRVRLDVQARAVVEPAS